MSLKSLLYLDSFPIKEEDIMRKLQEAYAQHKEVIEFSHNHKKVAVRISNLHPEGLMRGYFDYWSDRG